MRARNNILPALVLAASAAFAGVVDRIAVVVGDQVFTETEVMEELRVTQLLNGDPPSDSASERRAAAERLVDQQLIRAEMSIGGYEQPPENEAAQALREFRADRFPSGPQFRAALSRYNITEDQLKQHLRWQLAVLRFVDVRFRPLAAAAARAGSDVGGAERATGGVAPAASEDTDKQLEAWLRQARSEQHIEFKPEAFE